MQPAELQGLEVVRIASRRFRAAGVGYDRFPDGRGAGGRGNMDGNGARELGSAQVVRTFRSQVHAPRFGREGSRVGDIEQDASSGRLGNAYDAEKAYLLSVVAGWAYADGQTLADKIQHYGFEAGAYVQQFSVVNDAMLVVARAYLVRSQDGRAGILAFRGTEPVNAINWLTNAHTEARPFYGRGMVHHGFHANVEALWSYIEAALRDAEAGRPAPGNDAATPPRPLEGLEHLYVTGHSLGGAMAVLAAAKIFCDDKLASLGPLVRGVYTFGQPQVGDEEFVSSCPELGALVYRHEYRHDVVPVLPPSSVARSFAHLGKKRVTSSQHEPWQTSDQPTRPLRFLVQGLACVSAAFFTRRLLLLRRLDGLWYSIDDHLPQRYINTCKRSLTVEQAESASAGRIERVRHMAHAAAEVGKLMLRRTRRPRAEPDRADRDMHA